MAGLYSRTNQRGAALVVAVALLALTGVGGGWWYASGMVERVQVQPGVAVLDVGAGSAFEVAVDVARGRLPALRVEFELKLKNKNAVDVRLTRCTWRASVGGDIVSNGVLSKPVTLRSGQTTSVRFEARTRLEKLGAATLNALRHLDPSFKVEIDLKAGALGISSERKLTIDGFDLRPSLAKLHE